MMIVVLMDSALTGVDNTEVMPSGAHTMGNKFHSYRWLDTLKLQRKATLMGAFRIFF